MGKQSWWLGGGRAALLAAVVHVKQAAPTNYLCHAPPAPFSTPNALLMPSRLLTDGFVALSVGAALQSLPSDDPLAQLQAQLASEFRWVGAQLQVGAEGCRWDVAGSAAGARRVFGLGGRKLEERRG